MTTAKEYGEQLYEDRGSNGRSRRGILRKQKTHERHAGCPYDS